MALHIACQIEHAKIVRTLLDYGADPDMLNEKGLTAYEMTTNEEILRILGVYQQNLDARGNDNNSAAALMGLRQSARIDQQLLKELGEPIPSKPPFVRGNVYKSGRMLMNMMNLRYMVIDVDSGSLLRFKKREHYPIRANEVIPLKDITYVQLV